MSLLADEVAALRQELAEMKAELRLLRRGQPRADADSCEMLLGYLSDTFGPKPWTTAAVFEAVLDNPLLRGAIIRCIGEDLTIPKLSRFLSAHCGNWGEWRLRCVNRHSREGARFTVTKIRHFVTQEA